MSSRFMFKLELCSSKFMATQKLTLTLYEQVTFYFILIKNVLC